MFKYCVSFIYIVVFTFIPILYGMSASRNEPIQPLPTSVDVDPAKVEFGKQLFFDKRLSIDGSTSCESCHAIGGDNDKWGADNNKSLSSGTGNQLGTRNSPTLYNSVFNFKQLWDGRADTLAHQVRGVVLSPTVMGMKSWEDVVNKLKDDQVYAEQSEKIYGSSLSKENITDAIAEYEKTLITPNSPFDQYLNGDDEAISDIQKAGYQLFKSYGCVSCHQGKNVGGNMFQKFGVLKDISLKTGDLSDDLGRYNVTKNEWDKRVFRVPSLRLATKTPPYFHNGSVKTIEEAVDIMIKYQLGRGVPQKDRDAIIAFLDSLVGEKLQGVK